MPDDQPSVRASKTFCVELIRPSRYDDDGYVIQWWKSAYVSNTLACLHGLTQDEAARRSLGPEVEILADVHDEGNAPLQVSRIVRHIQHCGGHGLVCLVGVQTNQFPRAVDIGRQFRQAGIPVVIGGFHVSGMLAMIPEMTSDLKEALALGITLFAGEAEGRLGTLFADAYHDRLKPVYNYLGDLPAMGGQPLPQLPERMFKHVVSPEVTADLSRGCPFDCSFCSVINVQGRHPRYRTADDVERLVRASIPRNRGRNIRRFFFTDDNFARNPHWEAILDRLTMLREKEGLAVKFGIQVDVQAYKIAGFVEKSARAGCRYVFIGIESINPENLIAANKKQNRIDEYKAMLQCWRDHGVTTIGGYILGFPADTPESITRDIETIKRDLPLDVIIFHCLTPIPGSRDHMDLLTRGAWMEPDLNRYNGQYVTFRHPRMSDAEFQKIFDRAWELYYCPEHVETLLQRAATDGIGPSRLTGRILISHCSTAFEKVHPFECGVFRRKSRLQRRHGLPIENPFVFYPRRLWEILRTTVPTLLYALKLVWLTARFRRQARAAKKRKQQT
ncbi:MAG: hypothetical protein A3K19_16715 [Lentisphaerae bacterium RIFOXYB12_FULL_65_16]|nr:MAG: hypothetical protein A3K18_26695 [Lentisphaerae bacterium RIFOXYA12_64_32]OGV88963.1 MAG: hypothetical protein A3K19_16715 [Lentisphaerae bacterium RIFOXYB12_FULL_65_16]